jgi:hypothetical protein
MQQPASAIAWMAKKSAFDKCANFTGQPASQEETDGRKSAAGARHRSAQKEKKNQITMAVYLIRIRECRLYSLFCV